MRPSQGLGTDGRATLIPGMNGEVEPTYEEVGLMGDANITELVGFLGSIVVIWPQI